MSNLLGGKQGTAYLGTNANQPPNWVFCERNPQTFDIDYSLGDVWLNTTTQEKWVLVSLANPGGATPKGAYATWVPWGGAPGAGIVTLSGTNPGVFVPGNGANNVQLTTTIPGLTITGDAGLHSITFGAAGGGGLVTQLQGNVVGGGAAVAPDAGGIIHLEATSPAMIFTSIGAAPNTINLNLTGAGPGTIVQTISGDTATPVPPDVNGNINLISAVAGLTVVENPGLNTLVLTSSGGSGFLETLTGNVGGAVVGDALDNINVVTDVGIPSMVFDGTLAANTLTLRLTGGGPGTFGQTITTDDANVVSPDADGNWNLLGDGVAIQTAGNPGTNTLTVTYIGAPGPVFTWTVEVATPVALVANHGYFTSFAGTLVFTLPAAATVGDTYWVVGRTSTLPSAWRIAQNAGQRIYFVDEVTTLGAGGYLESTERYSSICLVCSNDTPGSERWSVVAVTGNITVV